MGSPGTVVALMCTATRDYALPLFNVTEAGADNWMPNTAYANNSSASRKLAWTDSAVFVKPAMLDGASLAVEGYPQIWLGSDEGMYVIHGSGSTDGGLIRLTETYASPYMKGHSNGAWPLHSEADVSPNGFTLGNNNTVTFSSGGPAGSFATFDGVDQYLGDSGEAGYALGTADWSIAQWVKSNTASIAAAEAIWYLVDGSAALMALYFTATDKLSLWVSDDNGSTADSATSSADFYDANWHYVVGSLRDEATFELWVDGILVASTAAYYALGTLNPTALSLGASSTPSEYFDGDIGGLSINAGVAMTEREIKAEYARGVRRMNSTIDTNDTISDNDVAAIAADPAGKYVTVMGDDKVVYIFDEFGVPVASDTYPGTTARDVAIKSMPGGTDPHYIMAGSDQIEIVQPNTRIEV